MVDARKAQQLREAARRRAIEVQRQRKQFKPKSVAQSAPRLGPAKPVVYVKPDVQPWNYNSECYIVGGGPSLGGFDWSKLDGKFVIAINRAYEVLPNAQILYFTDPDYWNTHKKAMLAHKGLKFRGRLGKKPEIKDPGVVEFQLVGQVGWSDKYGELYHGSNSGYACLQVAHQLGFTKIYLLGFDMKHNGSFKRGHTQPQGITHWHSGHRRIDPPSVYAMMMKSYTNAVDAIKKRGIEVINVNEPSKTALKTFPIKSYEEVFGNQQVTPVVPENPPA